MSRRGLLAGSLGAIAFVGTAAIPLQCLGKIYPGTQVQGISVAGMTPDGGEEVLREHLSLFEEHAVTFEFEGQIWQPNLEALGIAIDYDAVLDRAMEEGRRGSVVNRYRTYLTHDKEREVGLAFHKDLAVLTAYIESIGAEIDVAPNNARLFQQDDGAIDIQAAEQGRALNRDAALDETLELVRSGEAGIVTLRTNPVSPEVSANDLEGAREDAWRLVSEPIVFEHDGIAYPIGTEQLTTALKIGRNNSASLDTARLHDRMQHIAATVAVPARNVKLGWNGGLYVQQDDVDGLEADLETMSSLIQDAARTSDRKMALPVKPVRAEARADNFRDLGIDEHIGVGSSSFTGSSAARAANVGVSADNISFKLVAPGETFSFNRLLGPITEEYGYIAGTIIQGDWVASDIGGGVCQVSTTVFRAAVNAGFRFSEWNPHSWRLAFYEADGTSPGLDAAIYQPNTEWEAEQDLTFENPLDSWLLLMMVIDGDTVAAHFYGKNPGWQVELFPARISEPRPAGDPVERTNTTLAPGERRQVQQSQPGYTVSIRRTVTDSDGNLLADGDFVSDYQPQPEAWEVGPA